MTTLQKLYFLLTGTETPNLTERETELFKGCLKLINQAEDLHKELSKLKEERKWISETLKARSESLDEYNNEFFFLESLLSKFPEVPSTP